MTEVDLVSNPPLHEDQSAPEPALDAADVPVLAGLWQPLSATDPCGPDLDMDGDADYLNYVAHTEGILPTSFFSLDDKKPFDRTTIDLPGRLAALAPLFDRTRDLRLMALNARLSILNRDLAGFSDTVASIASWLDRYWDDIHPRPQDGDILMRETALSELDGPMAIFPLQYAPLFDTRRSGPISYRSWMIATGEVAPRPGETKLSPAAIVEAHSDTDADALATARRTLTSLRGSLAQIRNALALHQVTPGLENLSALVGKISLFIDPNGLEREQAAPAEGNAADSAPDSDASARSSTFEAPGTLAQASEALAAIASYYSQFEPSSPILPLVRQAHLLIGKSFYEVLSILVPTQMDKAAFLIGGDQVFELPVGKLSGLSAVSPITSTPEAATPDAAAGSTPRFRVASRSQAIALLDQVQRFFRHSEPSSPIPMLCDRARALAERDFMSVLRDVLPKAALKNIASDK
ncbi:type VI secretion system ImpA family N-terminal domain-containing protein [Rhodopseudomonas sp. P2A-2r]|uniref:type VI secretion system protein TssA n=1 Tax=Rhodopseudomonas sp. P2A-2r TaxID=2991972 RepID=UPI0022344B3B|nr:type VI secretion system ImpA family N-terminal domain-containing protein [Rhodopseudomonas sp. P2A-2r]UZE49064.1 type VI secretion system ImpA family N-terminal domain-containing protein [Rhodopseudomonas sp. P2A-2r]